MIMMICGIVGILGAVAAVVANFVGAVVNPDIGLVAQTISNLAAGDHAWIMDTGLYCFSVGIIAVAVGLVTLPVEGWAWKAGPLLMVLMAILIIVIGAHGEYGDGEPGGLVIHFSLTIAMALVFVAAGLLLSKGFHGYRRRWFWFNLAIVCLWVIGAAGFWFSPTSIDGAIERVVGAVCVIWLCALSVFLIRRSRHGIYG